MIIRRKEMLKKHQCQICRGLLLFITLKKVLLSLTFWGRKTWHNILEASIIIFMIIFEPFTIPDIDFHTSRWRIHFLPDYRLKNAHYTKGAITFTRPAATAAACSASVRPSGYKFLGSLRRYQPALRVNYNSCYLRKKYINICHKRWWRRETLDRSRIWGYFNSWLRTDYSFMTQLQIKVVYYVRVFMHTNC